MGLSVGPTAAGRPGSVRAAARKRDGSPWAPAGFNPGSEPPSPPPHCLFQPPPRPSLVFQGFAPCTRRSSSGPPAPSTRKRPQSPTFHTCKTAASGEGRLAGSLGPRDPVRKVRGTRSVYVHTTLNAPDLVRPLLGPRPAPFPLCSLRPL